MKYDKTILVICILVAVLFGGWYGNVWKRLYTRVNGYRPEQIVLRECDTVNKTLSSRIIATPTDYAPPIFLNENGNWRDDIYNIGVLDVPDTLTTLEFCEIQNEAFRGFTMPFTTNTIHLCVYGVNTGCFWFYVSVIPGFCPEPPGTLVTTPEDVDDFGIAIFKGIPQLHGREPIYRIHDVWNQPVKNVYDFMENRGITNAFVVLIPHPFAYGELDPFFYDFYRAHYGEDAFVATTNRIAQQLREMEEMSKKYGTSSAQ